MRSAIYCPSRTQNLCARTRVREVTFAGLPVAVGGVLGTMNKYGSARRAKMQKHPMAYVYELEA
jgi:hypothetical protein